MSLSIVMNNGSSCNMGCEYCCGDLDNVGKVNFDFPQLEKTLKENPNYGDNYKGEIDIWGGEPLLKIKTGEFQEVVDFFNYFYPEASLHTSTNGLLIKDDEVVDYLINNKIGLQLSHDGVGESIRCKDVDPLYAPDTFDNWKRLIDSKIFNMINCSLNGKNNSIYKNVEYFNKWRKYINEDLSKTKFMYIKLNHLSDSDYDDPELKFSGDKLRDYLHEYEMFVFDLLKTSKNDEVLGPYYGYFINQIDRFKVYTKETIDNHLGACCAFQRGIRNETFAIDTIGKYCECNLVDSSVHVANKGAKQPEYCKGCKYEFSAECNHCGSVIPPEKCEYMYAWNQFLERMKKLQTLVGELLISAAEKKE